MGDYDEIPEPAPGVRLGRWVLEERVGSGGLAEVWRAVAEDAPRPVALKILREPGRSAAHVSRFLREGRLLARLEHPGLPRCHEVLVEPRPALALDLLTGETLSGHLRHNGPLGRDAAERVAGSLLRVLEYLHQLGVVHRDVKSSNVYLADDRRVLLLDLGLAADPADPLTTTLGDVMGTYAYMAPEQIAGAEVDHRSDLYSLGVTLYEALAGTRPFQARGAAGYLRAHRSGQVPGLADVRPDIPPRLRDLVARLMARDPMVRPASAGIARALLVGASGADRALRDAPLVGRAAAQGAVEAALDAGGSVALLGEVGSGTARMATWALRRARDDHFESFVIRCRGRATPTDPLDQIVRDLSRIAGTVEPDAEHLGRALEAMCGEGRVLVCVEDADQASEEVLGTLWRAFSMAPKLSLVVTATDTPPGYDGHVVRLRPLTPEETWRIASGMLGTGAPPAGLAHELHQLSGGLPAIVVLAIKELVARGALWAEGVGDDGTVRWRLDRKARLEPTTGLVRLFGGVLQQLPDESRALLDVLAVVGEALPLDTALELAGADASGLATGPLVQAGLASREAHHDGDWIVLRRPAVGALVLQQVPGSRQTGIHRALAENLQSRPPAPWRDEQVAWHAAHGATADEAPGALLALGERLFERGQHGRALEVLDQASRIAGADTGTTAALAISRGEVLDAVARRDEALEALNAGRRLAADRGESALVGRALVGLARVHHGLGDERRSVRCAEEAMELLSETPDAPPLPQALLLAADAHRHGARTDESRVLYQRCIRVARAQGALHLAAMAEGGLGTLLAQEGQLDDAIAHLQREVGHLRAHGQAHKLVPALFRLASTQRRLGLPDEALATFDEAGDAARFARLPYERARVDTGRAGVHLVCGDWAGTNQLLRRARAAADPDADSFLRLAYREVQAGLRLARGDRQAALAVFQAAEAEAGKAGFVALGAYFLGMVGVLTADPDALTDAMDVLGVTGDRRLAGKLLLHGAVTGGDAEILASAEQEARHCGDRFLLLDVLHASGGPVHREEARRLAAHIDTHVPGTLRAAFRDLPAVRWAGLPPAPSR